MSTSNKRIMIVEDNAAFRHCLNSMLLDRFPDLSIIEDSAGDRVLEQIHALHPAMVLMDIRLPRINGLDLTRKIKSERPETFVAVMTSSSEPEYGAASTAAGADRFFVKGQLDCATISELIRSVVYSRNSSR